MKRSPLKRSTTPINRVSAKTFDKQRTRRKIVAAHFKAHPFCANCIVARASHPHEPWSRGRGGPIDDPRNLVGLCAECHEWVHRNPLEAKRRGLLVSAHEGAAWLERGGVNQ